MGKKNGILIIAPSINRSHGGMSTVVRGILEDEELGRAYELSMHPSYIDGALPTRLLYSAFSFFGFLFKARRCDLYHIHVASFGSTFRKRLYLKVIKKSGRKAIAHIHGAKYMEFYAALSDKKKRKVRQFLKDADMVIALSRSWKDTFDETFGLTNCVVLENGIDTDTFASAVTPPEENSHSFAVLGRLGQRKGTYDLLDAMEQAVKEVPDIRCYLAGDGEIDKVKGLVRSKGLENNIEVIGWIGMEKKLEVLRQVSTVLLPSYNEGLPMSLLEGMAAGKAIVSTRVGAIPELVSEENGILINAGDVPALAGAIVRCCTDIPMLSSMSEANRMKITEQFSERAMHRRLSEYYRQVMES